MVQEQGHVDGHVCGDDGVFRQTGHFDDRFRRCTQREEISCLDAVIFKLAQDMQLGFLNQPCFVFKFQKVKGQNFCNILRVPKFTDFVS